MNESGSKGRKPLFSQTFLGAIIVAVVGGVLVWVVTNSLSRNSATPSSPSTISSESSSDTPPNIESVSEVRNASGDQVAKGKRHTDLEPRQGPADTPSDLNSATTPIVPTPPPVASRESRRQTKQGFEFLLERCTAEGEDINCWFLVTNKLGQPKISIFKDYSWLDDQDHNRRQAWHVLESDGSMESNILQLRLPNDSPVRFGLHFQGLKKSVTSISFLNLHIRNDDLGWRDVEVE
jgi:hypothetical protein